MVASAGGSGGGGAAAAVVVAEPAIAPGVGHLDLDGVKSLWSAVADAVADQNAMVAALISSAVPSALEGDRLTVAFPQEAAFLKRKAEGNREMVTAALRSLTGRALVVAFELGDLGDQRPARTLSEDELLELLKRDFAAEEIFEESED